MFRGRAVNLYDGNGTPRGTSETTYTICGGGSANEFPGPPGYRLPEIKTRCAARGFVGGANDIAAPFKRTVALLELARKNKKAFKCSSLALERPFFVLYCDIMRASGNLLYHYHFIQIFSATREVTPYILHGRRH